MCVIIHRPAGKTINKKEFDACFLNNSDGYGFCVPDGMGRLFVQREVSEETKGEDIYDLIHTEFKDDDVLLHLRYTTAGETILRNAHPFPVLEKSNDITSDIRMMHNGTIHKFKPKQGSNSAWQSDTRIFTQQFVRPLFDRMSYAMDSEEILKDYFVQQLLDDQLPDASVLVFMDGHGNVTKINGEGNGGFTNKDGIYFSNKYSLDVTHRLPTRYTPSTYSTGYGYSSPRPQSTAAQAFKENDVNQPKFNDKYSEKLGVNLDADLVKHATDDVIKEITSDAEVADCFIKGLLHLISNQEKEIDGLKDTLVQARNSKAGAV